MRRTGVLVLLLAVAASQLPVASPDETPPLGLYPESPRPNRHYWRWEEFAAASLGEGCMQRETYKARFKEEATRRIAVAAAAMERQEEEAALAQCAAAAEEQDQRNQDCTAVGVGCDGAPADSVTADCGEPFGEAVAAASVLDSTSACAVAEAQPKLDAPPVPAFTCTRQLPAAQEFGACGTSCTYRQCTYTCVEDILNEEMKCAQDGEECQVARPCGEAALEGDEGASRASCEGMPQGRGTVCVYTTGGAGALHAVCVALFLAFVAVMLVSMIPIAGKPWWPPFRERGASVLLLNAVGALICAWATLVTDGHAPFWLLGGQTNAQLWLCWLRLFWGFALWHCTIAVRLHAMGQLYIHDAEPLFWPIKLLQYLAPWLLTCILMTTTQDPPFAMSTAVIVLCFFSFFHAAYLAAPLLPLRKTLPEVRATAIGVTAGLANTCWLYIAIEQEADDGCSVYSDLALPCAASDAAATAAARKFVGTTATILVLGATWLGVNGGVLYQYFKQDPAYLAKFEAPPGKRAPNYVAPVPPETPPDEEEPEAAATRRAKKRGEPVPGADTAGNSASFTGLFAEGSEAKPKSRGSSRGGSRKKEEEPLQLEDAGSGRSGQKLGL